MFRHPFDTFLISHFWSFLIIMKHWKIFIKNPPDFFEISAIQFRKNKTWIRFVQWGIKKKFLQFSTLNLCPSLPDHPVIKMKCPENWWTCELQIVIITIHGSSLRVLHSDTTRKGVHLCSACTIEIQHSLEETLVILDMIHPSFKYFTCNLDTRSNQEKERQYI